VVKRGRSLVQARDVLILLREGEELVLAGAAGESQLTLGQRIAAEAPIVSTAPGGPRAVRLAPLTAAVLDPLGRLGVTGASAALLVPLVYRGKRLGVLAALDRLTADMRFSADDESLMIAFAASTATAVATARTVNAERLRQSIEAAEAERRRWARELHDETLQGLAALKVQLAGARALGDLDRTRAAIDAAVGHLSDDIAALRVLITDLRPSALDELGLGPALDSLAERVRTQHGIDVRLRVELDDGEDRRLAPDVETAAYRIVQEALSNVGKHAGASAAEILVEEADAALHVRVADDGSGFDPDERTAGFGLIGMDERAQLLGGEVSIEPGDPGTILRARLPIAPA
jgi:signal transduction histidine kinase